MKHVTAADVAVLLVVLVWGGSYPIVKSAFDVVTPLSFTLVRFAIASVALAPIVIRDWRRHRLTTEDWLRTIATGLLTITLYQIGFSIGLLHTKASNSSLIIGSAPVLTLALAYLTRLERPTAARTAGILLALLGVILVIGGSDGLGFSGSTMRGDLISAAAALSYAASTIISRPVITKHSSLFVMGLAITVGTVALIPVCLGEVLRQDWVAVDVLTWLKIGYSALLAGSAGYVAWYRSIGRIGATRTAAFGYFIPVVAVTLSSITLGETMTVASAAGAVVVLLGVALTRWGDAWSRMWADRGQRQDVTAVSDD